MTDDAPSLFAELFATQTGLVPSGDLAWGGPDRAEAMMSWGRLYAESFAAAMQAVVARRMSAGVRDHEAGRTPGW